MEQTNVTTVANDVVVGLDYVLTVEGQIIDSTTNGKPLQYLHGHGNIIPGLENALAGMAVGESKDVLVPAADAYGVRDPNAFADIPREQFPPHFDLKVGASLNVRDDHGRVLRAYVAEVGEDTVRLDLNHPLAGKDLSFWARVAELRPATEDEIAASRVGGSACASCHSSDCSSGCS